MSTSDAYSTYSRPNEAETADGSMGKGYLLVFVTDHATSRVTKVMFLPEVE